MMSVEIRPEDMNCGGASELSETHNQRESNDGLHDLEYRGKDDEEEENVGLETSTLDYNDIGGQSLSDEAMIDFARNNYAPYYDEEGSTIVDVDCGGNKAQLYVNKLCQGSKGLCIYHRGNWYTPNEFQSFCGRETAKDWKRSIRHRGKSLKILMARGLLSTHHSSCDCPTCRFQLTKPRFEKRQSMIPSNKLSNDMDYVSTSSSSVEYVTLANGRKVKRNGETDGALSSIINNLHQANNINVSDSEENNGSIDASRKRSLLAAGDSNQQKRARSISPPDDIYDQEQRQIYQAANSPEPQKIENVRQSLVPTDRSESASPVENIDTNAITATNALHKSRKQISPQHIELQQLSLNIPNNRLQQSSNRRYSGRTGVLDRGHPSSSSAHGHRSSPMKMIALTRPDSANFSRGSNNINSHRSNNRNTTSAATTSQPDDLTDWSIDDVSNFVSSLRGCEEYAMVFRDQGIDGEILTVLTEDHLLNHMGLKLGPALKIRLRVAKKLGYTLDGQYGHLAMSQQQLLQSKPEPSS
ncbi:deformed epidermal autoregulatory factor 1-like isoform X2 [Anneissia japonica]|uniref:deformed epidermal autoregulatory factor 1-like isoform X2 n=1 Tax=Anneissia japonica TaxID=1529436 RepID=UPI0014258BB2|nr:deformed epidermal autoregulatory factor 1-like isoform X2 [Anneissia japonica]